MHDAPASARLVHGLPIGRGEANAGQRFWHAWVEVFEFGVGWVVFDHSNGKRLTMARRDYYAAGQLDESTVYRYSQAKAAQMMRTHSNYGPWVDGWEGMGL